MLTLALANQKGGVGKTTLAITLAAWLAGEKGLRVLLVDLDPQGNIAQWFGMADEPGVYKLLSGQCNRPTDPLRLLDLDKWWPDDTPGTLVVLPGNGQTAALGELLARNTNALRQTLAQYDDVFDVIVLDTSPTVTSLTANFFVASDFVIIPTETKSLSVYGARATEQTVRIIHERIPLDVLGIQPTMHHAWKRERRDNHKELKDRFGALVWDTIGDRVPWEEAPSYGRSIFAYAGRHKAVSEAHQFGANVWTALEAKGVIHNGA